MKRTLFLRLIFSLTVILALSLNGCKNEDEATSNDKVTSKTDLLCRTWIWGDENDQNWKTYMTFYIDGTAQIEDINLSTNYTAYFQYSWKWGNVEETLLVLTSNKSGKIEHFTIVSITQKDLIIKDESGNKVVIKAK